MLLLLQPSLHLNDFGGVNAFNLLEDVKGAWVCTNLIIPDGVACCLCNLQVVLLHPCNYINLFINGDLLNGK